MKYRSSWHAFVSSLDLTLTVVECCGEAWKKHEVCPNVRAVSGGFLVRVVLWWHRSQFLVLCVGLQLLLEMKIQHHSVLKEPEVWWQGEKSSPLGHSEGGGKPLVIFPFSHLHVSWEGIAVSGHRHSRLCQLLHREINSLNPPLNWYKS